MKMIITSDLHLDSNPENQYRFDFLDYLLKEEDADYLIVCGDILDKKDNHPANFVNKVIDYLHRLSDIYEIHILFGNHDGTSNDSAYLKFINKLNNIYFYTSPIERELEGNSVLFLPNTRTPIEDWKDLDMEGFDFIFGHQTITGAKASNGFELEGLSTKWIKENMEAKWVIFGDIHLPQKVGPVTYVGAPYHTRFGEGYIPQYFIYDNNKLNSVTYDKAPRKVKSTIADTEQLEDLDLREGDMLKVDLVLPKSEFVNHKQHEQTVQAFCDDSGIILKGVKIKEAEGPSENKKQESRERMELSKHKLFEDFCSSQKLDKQRKKAGEELLK